jgi:hypothetical protein
MRFLGRRRDRQLAEREEYRQVRRVVADDVDDLAARLRELPGAPDGERDQQRALELLGSARSLLADADDVPTLRNAWAQLDEARFHLARLVAGHAGRPLPERREPCGFDPRHGPSVCDVVWTPPHGTARKVAACETDARLIEADAQPDHRLVRVGDRYVPWYVATPLAPGGAFDSAAAALGGAHGHVGRGADTRLTDKHVAEAHLRSAQNPDANGAAHGL